MVKRNLLKGLALFIVLTFVMSTVPSVCFAEGETGSSNIVFQIWNDTPLSDIDASDNNYTAKFYGNVTTGNSTIKFRNIPDGYAMDEKSAAAIFHANYKDAPNNNYTFYVDFGADISGKVLTNGYDKTFVSFYFQPLNRDKIDLSKFEIGAYYKDEENNRQLYAAVPFTKYARIMPDKWTLLEFSMKDLGLDGNENAAFCGLYFNTAMTSENAVYGNAGKFDKLNIVNSVGGGNIDFTPATTRTVAPDLGLIKTTLSDTKYVTEGRCIPADCFDNTAKKIYSTNANAKDEGIQIQLMGNAASNTTKQYIKIFPFVNDSSASANMADYYETDGTDLVLKIKAARGTTNGTGRFDELFTAAVGKISIGVGRINKEGTSWYQSALKLGLVEIDKSKLIATDDYVQYRIPLSDFINSSSVYELENDYTKIDTLSLENINVFSIVLDTKIAKNSAIALYIDEAGLAPHTEAVVNKTVYSGGTQSQNWGMSDGAKEPLCYTITSSGNSPVRLYDTTKTERTDYGTSNQIIYTWAYWGNDIYTPEYEKIGISFNAPKLKADTENTITFGVNNYTSAPVTPTLVIAYYKDNALSDVKIVDNVTFASGRYSGNNVDADSSKDYDYYKAFILDSMDSVIPLAGFYKSPSAAE